MTTLTAAPTASRRNVLGLLGGAVGAAVAPSAASACHNYAGLSGEGCGAFYEDLNALPSTPSCISKRGPVRVVGNQVWTDTNWPLQGAHGWWENDVGFDIGWWETNRDQFRLNCIRLDTRITQPDNSNSLNDLVPNLNTVFSRVDKYVYNAGRAGMYIIIDNHTSCCGYYNIDLQRRFWDVAAKRYRNETHVLYEIQNEPTKWPHVSNPSQLYADQHEIYRLVRGHAPNRHIILFSMEKSASGLVQEVRKLADSGNIDWSNASVAVHPYRHRSYDPGFVHLTALNNAFPSLVTEFNGAVKEFATTTNDREIWNFCIPRKMSWVRLELLVNSPTPYDYDNNGDGATKGNEWPLLWQADPGTVGS